MNQRAIVNIPYKILVINQYASCPKYSTGAGERHFYIAKELLKRGIKTRIISASFNHLFHQHPKVPKGKLFLTEEIEGVEFIWIKTRKYSSTSGIGRAYSWIEFLVKLYLMRGLKDFNCVLVSSMSLLPALFAIRVKRIFKIPFIMEIRDIWPLTFKELGGYSNLHPVVFFLTKIESMAYKNADSITSVLPGFKSYFAKYYPKLEKDIHWIPNGISSNFQKQTIIQPQTLDNKNFKIVYTGAIGIANHLRYFIEAAILLEDKKDIEFHILGDGYEKQELESMVLRHELINVFFYNKLPKSEVQSFVKKASICYHGCKDSYLYTYGISPNKMNDYMLAAKPILSASSLKNDPVNIAKCGLVVESGNAQAIADGILKLKSLPKDELELLGQNGYDYLISNQTYKVLSEQYFRLLSDLKIIK